MNAWIHNVRILYSLSTAMVSLHIRHSALQKARWILAICMSEYSGVKIFNFPNLVCFFKESSAGQIKGLSGPDVARGPYFGDPWSSVSYASYSLGGGLLPSI